ncbi:hypothetical protein HF086_016130 [Spodoptera exigua]|uniref:Uncharacterized protein n=1 Tax=Spodoptera exigua TaxID=7107 RepID=A0A922ME16_SPOEX|nr:hypothetical protein HF086_016130 [Spodoptera exigua]
MTFKTQNAITNLQAKLQSSRTNNFSSIPSALTSSLISEKTAISRLPISQLSRSNSLNYRLRRKDHSNDSSPLRSPGHYVITGSTKVPESTKILLNSASRSLDTDKRHDLNMNSPSSDRGLLSNSSDDKTLSNRPPYDVEAILSPHRKTHSRNRTFESQTHDVSNANPAVCLKTVLKNNALDSKYPRIEPTRCQGDKKCHQRVLSDGLKYKPNNIELPSRRSSGHSEEYKDYSDESDNGSYDKSQECRYKRQVINRGRIDSPDLKSVAPANSPRRCPNTPEMHRKFGPGLVRNSVRVTNKERLSPRVSEQPIVREERVKPTNHQSRRSAEPRQTTMARLTKSRSSTREVQPKHLDKGQKKPSQHRSSSALATKEIEFSNWKKRASYDPMKAAQEDKRRKQLAKRQDFNKDDLSSPSHSSPVHRSQSFHTNNIADLETLDYSSEETEDDQMLVTLPVDPMVTSTHSDILDLRPKDYSNLRRQAMTNDVVLSRDYVTSFQINQSSHDKKRREAREADKRKTFIIDDITPTKENIDFLTKTREDSATDKRKTFILDSDTNSTTNGTAVTTQCHRQRPRSANGSRQSSPGTWTSPSTRTNSPRRTSSEGIPWKRRASYDPRKAAALGKSNKTPSKTASSVLRSQSFHGPVTAYTGLRPPPPDQICETYDASSDNDF